MGGMRVDARGLAAMVVAMMLTIDAARALARRVPWRRRHRAAAGFLAGYLAVWMLAILLIDTAGKLLASRAGGTAAAVAATGAAVLWEFARPSRPDADEGDRRPAAARGWRADATRAWLGVRAAQSCVVSCWALMAACVAFAHSLPVMVVLFCVQWIERHRQPASPAAAALAVLAACAAALVLRMASHHAM
jgi:hypothetical protein